MFCFVLIKRKWSHRRKKMTKRKNSVQVLLPSDNENEKKTFFIFIFISYWKSMNDDETLMRPSIFFVRSISVYITSTDTTKDDHIRLFFFVHCSMKFSFVFVFVVVLVPFVENHFFNWIWNKIQRVVDPTKPRRTFDCGQTDVRPNLPSKFDSPRVTGGLSAIDHSFPWVVNVLNVKSMKSCGGAIISPTTILTGKENETMRV